MVKHRRRHAPVPDRPTGDAALVATVQESLVPDSWLPVCALPLAGEASEN